MQSEQFYPNCFSFAAEEAQVAMLLKQLGIKYSKLIKDEFVTLMDILRKSDMLKSSGSKRGKGNRKNDSNKKTGPDALSVISVSEPVFSMVFPMNSLAGFSLRFLMLFSLTFNTVQCII